MVHCYWFINYNKYMLMHSINIRTMNILFKNSTSHNFSKIKVVFKDKNNWNLWEGHLRLEFYNKLNTWYYLQSQWRPGAAHCVPISSLCTWLAAVSQQQFLWSAEILNLSIWCKSTFEVIIFYLQADQVS